MKRDERLRRAITEAVVGDDPKAADELERQLADRAELLAEYRELQALWDELASLREPEISDVARARARKAAFGELAGRGRRPWSAIAAAAAALAFFIGGYWVGTSRQPTPIPQAGAEYALIIRGRVDPELEAEVGGRMGTWARELASEGRLVFADRLMEDSMRWVGQRRDARGEAPPVSGLFLLHATSLDEAQRLASAAPHLNYGGAVEVLPVAHE